MLPEKFVSEIKKILQCEKEQAAFFDAYEKPFFKGVRLNTLKCTEEVLARNLPFPMTPSPFSPLSFYAQKAQRVGTLPAHHAGMFYSQEPSAASAVTVLDPLPGEKILDLCAAPGGKSSQIGTLLQGEGLLWSNEIVRSRAQSLLSNLERMGLQNAVVSSTHPQKLCEGLQGYFDKVLVDAPCSGEGMFRKDVEAIQAWSPEHVHACAQRQRAILDSAALALRPGGILVYSTCTFSREENEETVLAFLQSHPEFLPCSPGISFGRPALMDVSGVRIFPMDGGEGHFVAKLQKRSDEQPTERAISGKAPGKQLSDVQRKEAEGVYASLFKESLPSQVALFGEKLYILPQELPPVEGLSVLRAGIEGFEQKGKRLEPCHSLFMSRTKETCHQTVDFTGDNPVLTAFLRGEEIDCGSSLSGYCAVCLDGVVTGFGKASGGRLKNRYPKGLRNIR